jgi:preprotein translocase subunit SecY
VLSWLANAWRVPELRKRILFTFFILALSRFAIFALGIMPYVTASIILQLMTVVVPKLEQLQKEGEAGYAKINQYTRYLTVALAAAQSTGYAYLFKRAGNLNANSGRIILIVVTLTAGCTLLMWMGELITKRGVGNGISLLIFASILSSAPVGISAWYNGGTMERLFFPLVALGIIAAVVFIQEGQRRIPVQYAKRVIGRRMSAGGQTYLPLRVNMAGVIPVIFASSLLYIPTLAAQLFGSQTHPQGWVAWVDRYLVRGDSVIYSAAFFLLIVGFTYFYVSITFNPTEVADNMKKYGGFIPGIRPGRPTAEYLRYVLSRLTAPGSVYLGIVALFPLVALGAIGIAQQFPFSGVSLLIMVGVGLDTVKQIESQLQQRNYEGFLR